MPALLGLSESAGALEGRRSQAESAAATAEWEQKTVARMDAEKAAKKVERARRASIRVAEAAALAAAQGKEAPAAAAEEARRVSVAETSKWHAGQEERRSPKQADTIKKVAEARRHRRSSAAGGLTGSVDELGVLRRARSI